MDNTKFLSHRLRGFDNIDSSLIAITKAVQSDAPYLEIDTRVSKDGIIYVAHDDALLSDKSSLSISEKTSSEIDTFIQKNSLKVITLDALLNVFSRRKNNSQVLMIDIKDYGFEMQHLDLVKKYKLTKHITWVSWIPQSLQEMDKLDPFSPKILSFIPVNNFFALLTKNISIKKVPFIPIVLIGRNYYNANLKTLAHGYQHAYLSYKLNKDLITLLSKNGGGVCISKHLITKNQLTFNKKNALKTAIFSARNRQDYNKLVALGADIVFCDFIDRKIMNEF